jgi:TRAP-type C4-dicarboxylate transport system substrate-binding protein
MSCPGRSSLLRAASSLLALLSIAGAAVAAPVTLKLGHVAGADPKDNWQAGAVKFAELVDQKSKGDVKVQVFPSSQLGNDRDMAEGMRLGSVDFSLKRACSNRRASALEIPYTFAT